MISTIQKQRILDYLSQGKRFDGRGLMDLRDIKVQVGISQNAEGSCSLKIGDTEVYVGVKMAVAAPYPDNPDEGSLSTTLKVVGSIGIVVYSLVIFLIFITWRRRD